MCFFMFGANLKVTNSSFQKGMTFCRCIYVKKVMKLLAFIFEQSSYDLFSTNYAPILANISTSVYLISVFIIITVYILNLFSTLTPLSYHIFDNIRGNGAFALLEQMLHFP